MISDIEMTMLVTGLQTGLYRLDDNVLRAMAYVPRHKFLNRNIRHYAYQNIALPLDGKDYLIPEPFVTAFMIHLMQIKPSDRVLEIGFGTGYEAAIISVLAHEVYSIQQTEPLNKRLSKYMAIEKRGYNNVFTKTATGTEDWVDEGPFDAILIRQSMDAPPPLLLQQLKPGGRLVMPVGKSYAVQRLVVYYKQTDGSVSSFPTLHMKISPLFKGLQI